MKGKLKIILPVLLLVLAGGGGAYKFLLSGGGSGTKAAPPKVAGELLPLAPDFTVNLDGGHYGKVTVALEMEGAIPKPAEGATTATLKENAVVRSIVTNDLTGLTTDELIQRGTREKLLKDILKDLQSQTDEKVTHVFFTDVVVQ
ncbi:MAG TPA: flagellar basal body-associated FliL family protein [Gaiellales bacterium]|nr:flagellar basal body-associated FliL family protein [Gaiellales bacterium]